MNIAYLILAHNNPIHFRRLIKAISSSTSGCFAHIDKKSNLSDFSAIDSNDVHFSKERLKVYRSHFSQVEAILNLIQQSLDHPTRFDRFVLLSGTDYPIRSSNYIETFFERNSTSEFLNLVAMPNHTEGLPLSRLTTYKPTPTQPRSFLERLARFPLRKIGIIPNERNYKKYLGGMTPYGGSEWWALTRNACSYIMDFVNNNKEFVEFFRHSLNPEEMFFQIILGNSPFSEKITNYLTYTDWSAGGGSPAWIKMNHLTKYEPKLFRPIGETGSSEFIFARKFSDCSSKVVDAVEQLIEEFERSNTYDKST